MLVVWLIRVVLTIVFVLAGFRKVNFQPLRHLLTMSIDDVLENRHHDNWFWPKSWDDHTITHYGRSGLPIFSPLALISLGLFVYTFFAAAEIFSWSEFLLVFGISTAVAAVGVAIFHALVSNGKQGYDTFKEHRALELEARPKPVEPPPPPRSYMVPATMTFLSCDGLAAPRTYRTLPKQQRTVRLWFEDTKARVCRPYGQ